MSAPLGVMAGEDATRAGPEFVVLTGFLGSGKTTLLCGLLSSPDAAATAIIVNEVGEIGLDGAILREAGGDVAMATLVNGCICCQLGSDLAVTVEALLAADRPAGAPPLRRIVLETSGVSKPGPILRQLSALAPHRLRVSVLCTYDATRGPDLGAFAEAAAQWAGAQRLVVTKADLVPPARLSEARAEAAAINPLADIVAEPDRAKALQLALAPPGRPADPAGEPEPAASLASHPRLSSTLLRQVGPIGYDALAGWLDNLAGELGDRLLRLKGVLDLDDRADPVLVQSVGTVFSMPRPFRRRAAEVPFLVVIARDLDPGRIEAVTPALPLRRSLRLGRAGRASEPGPRQG